MKTIRMLAAVCLTAGPLAAQQGPSPTQAAASARGDAQAQLAARGLPAELAASVSAVARATDEKGLPGQAIVDKAVEGWFKRVPPQRLLAAVRDLAQRLERARADLRAAGVAQPEGRVIAASADAAVQGIARGDQVAIIQASRNSASAAAGLSVSAALVVQGLDPSTSARLVVESYRAGRSAAQVLDLPAAASALQARGVATTDIGRQLLEGIGVSGTVRGRTGVTINPPPLPGVIP